MWDAKVVVEFSSHCTGELNEDLRRIPKLSQEPLNVLALCCTMTSVPQLSDLAPEGGYARLAHTTQYIERETPPTATSTSAESNI